MTWEKIKNVLSFVVIYVFAVVLIEYQAEDLVAEMAGDMFGSMALLFVGVSMALSDEEA